MEHPENSGEYKGLVVNAGIEQPSSVNPYLKRAVCFYDGNYTDFI